MFTMIVAKMKWLRFQLSGCMTLSSLSSRRASISGMDGTRISDADEIM